ncbi:MAG: hypothetical protein ABI954_07685 [Pyrinomonadaceae bacterium]
MTEAGNPASEKKSAAVAIRASEKKLAAAAVPQNIEDPLDFDAEAAAAASLAAAAQQQTALVVEMLPVAN